MKFILTYIDPASGSVVFQLILAGLLGFMVYLKRIRFFVMGLFKKKKKDNDQP